MKTNAEYYPKTSALSFVWFTLMPLISSSLVSWFFIENQIWVQSLHIFGWLVLTLIFTFMCALALAPPTFLAVLMGYFIGYWSLPLLLIINFGAIFFIYILYKNLDFKWLENFLDRNSKSKILLNNIKLQELKFIFFAKLSPVLPFALTNLTFAISGAKIKNILVGGFLGMLPRTILAIYTGTEAKEIQNLIENPQQGMWQKIVILILVIVSFWGIMRIIKIKEVID